MASRKRGKSDKRKGKRLKIAYENPECNSFSSSSWAPKNWREQYDNIKKMREKSDAPVDTVGASKLADTSALPEVRRLLYLETNQHVTIHFPALSIDFPALLVGAY